MTAAKAPPTLIATGNARVAPMTEAVPSAGSPMARWSQVLDAFTERDVWGVRELAAHIGLPRSAVHRMLHEMARLELLTDADAPGRFRVGPALTRLATLLAERVDVRRIARPIMEAAAAELDETLVLALYSPSRRQFWAVDAVESTHPIRYIWGPLRRWSELHAGSSGKGILAFLPDDERAAILASLPAHVPDLRAELDLARSRGYVVSHGERFPGAVGVSAPLHDAAGRVIGDLVFGWPDNRTSVDKEVHAARIVTRAAGQVSSALGYRG